MQGRKPGTERPNASSAWSRGSVAASCSVGTSSAWGWQACKLAASVEAASDRGGLSIRPPTGKPASSSQQHDSLGLQVPGRWRRASARAGAAADWTPFRCSGLDPARQRGQPRSRSIGPVRACQRQHSCAAGSRHRCEAWRLKREAAKALGLHRVDRCSAGGVSMSSPREAKG